MFEVATDISVKVTKKIFEILELFNQAHGP